MAVLNTEMCAFTSEFQLWTVIIDNTPVKRIRKNLSKFNIGIVIASGDSSDISKLRIRIKNVDEPMRFYRNQARSQ